MKLPNELTDSSLVFQSLFSKRVWPRAHLLLRGAMLGIGRRTVAAVLRIMGLSEEEQFQQYHRVLNRVKWSGLKASRLLLMALIAAFAPSGLLIMVLDDTIERRYGAKIAARGLYRDPVRSSHNNLVKTSGLRWLCLMLVVPIPWAGRYWALPFCTALTPSRNYYLRRRRQPCKLADRARQMLLMVRRWLPERPIVVVADNSFAVLELLAAVRRKVCIVTRLRLDAALYDPAPPRQPGTIGRPLLKGPRQPKLQEVLENPATRWRSITPAYWYGHVGRPLDIVTGTALWYHGGAPAVPLRWVLVRDPKGKLKPQAFLCTDQKATPAQILDWFVKRWQIEVTFEESRAHLGVETQRHWSAKAIARTTPAILALYSLVALQAKELLGQQGMPVRQAAWYRKDAATFSDTIALVRRWLWYQEYLSISEKPPDMIKIPAALFERFTDALSYAV